MKIMTTLEDFIRDEIISGIPIEKTLIAYLNERYEPEEVFDVDNLERWAINNGFKREDK